MRRKDARGNGNGGANQQRQKRKLQRRGIAFKNNSPYGRLKLQRIAQVSVRQLPKVVPILRGQRTVEPQRMPELRQFPGRGAFPKHLLYGIAGDDVNHQEDQREHQPEGGQGQQKTLQRISQHRQLKNPAETIL